MAKFIAYLTGKPIVHGFRRKDFIWMEQFQAFVLNQNVFTEHEFNKVAERLHDFRHLEPKIKCVDSERKPIDLDEAAPVPQPPPKPTPEEKRQMTITQALEVLQTHAPHLLKKAPKPAPEPVAASA